MRRGAGTAPVATARHKSQANADKRIYGRESGEEEEDEEEGRSVRE